MVAAKAAAAAAAAAKAEADAAAAAAAAAAALAAELLANPPPPPPNPFNLLDPMHNDITARPLPQHLLEIASSTIPSWLPPGATLEQCIYDSAAVAPPPPVMQQHAAPPPSPASAALHFHTACDSRGPTLIIIQDTRGNAFGAYVPCVTG